MSRIPCTGGKSSPTTDYLPLPRRWMKVHLSVALNRCSLHFLSTMPVKHSHKPIILISYFGNTFAELQPGSELFFMVYRISRLCNIVYSTKIVCSQNSNHFSSAEIKSYYWSNKSVLPSSHSSDSH